ncbi:MAG TPA: glycosyltransferase family 39 protein [Blastocatellia bacterium]|nr:glycosyltransferase family 39 protein [Blastocatellia bacterium]
MNGQKILVEQPPAAKSKLPAPVIILALVAVTHFFGLGWLALLGPDEPRYAEVGREMYVSGDYISPRLCGCLWLEKPVLYYWGAAAAYHLFPVNEFSARFPSALAAAVTALFLFFALRKSLSARLGLSAAVVLATSGIFIGYARAATPDMLLTAAMSVALVAGWLAPQKRGREQFGYWALCWIATGIAVLAKGLVGVVLTVAILVLYYWIAGIRIRWQQWAAGLLIFIAVAALWYAPVTLRHGWAFIDEFIIGHHFRRYVSNRFGHPQPVYFFPLIALAGVIPWTFFLLPAIARLRSLRPRAERLDSLLSLAWVWAAVPVIFFSFSGSKLPGYILMVFPALAILIGAEVERVWSGERTRLLAAAQWLTALTLISFGIAFVVYLRQQAAPTGGYALLQYVPLCIGALALLALARSRANEFLTAVPVAVMSLVAGIAILLFPTFNETLSLKSLSLQAAAALQPGERITFYVLKEFAPVFYAEGRVVCDTEANEVLNALDKEKLVTALETHPGLIVISKKRWQGDVLTDPRFDARVIATQRDVSAIHVRRSGDGE